MWNSSHPTRTLILPVSTFDLTNGSFEYANHRLGSHDEFGIIWYRIAIFRDCKSYMRANLSIVVKIPESKERVKEHCHVMG